MSVRLSASDEELKQRFHDLRDIDDVADLLEISKGQLYYYVFVLKSSGQYRLFEIPKKSGGTRQIVAPVTPLKIIQSKLNQVLQSVYSPKASVHGFTRGRSILSNAKRHLESSNKRKYILNIDLQDFFPSITQQRVAGLFRSVPFSLPHDVAKLLAYICCYNGYLPQGSPTSPVVSNMICARMDTQLRKLAMESKCIYTRYADDITFSTSLSNFPSSIATHDKQTNQLAIGDRLNLVIQANGFSINAKKTRLQSRVVRQEVTGLIINKFPNVPRKFVRQIRAMLHAWEKYGIENAQKQFESVYCSSLHKKPSFIQVVRGKIEYLRMIRGEDSLIYIRFRDKLARLDPSFKYKERTHQLQAPVNIYVATEGRSDWKHLKAALQRFKENKEFLDLDVEFWEYEENPQMSDGELLKMCQYRCEAKLNKLNIYVFDRDNPIIVKQVKGDDSTYKKWGENLYSFAIPVPSHRVNTPDVCIELYYQDTDIQKRDSFGRRLFLSSEFDKTSGRHLDINENLNCLDPQKIKRSVTTIIDDKVFDKNNKNVALPKNDFAKYILEKRSGFDSLDISAFRQIFETMRVIIRHRHANG